MKEVISLIYGLALVFQFGNASGQNLHDLRAEADSPNKVIRTSAGRELTVRSRKWTHDPFIPNLHYLREVCLVEAFDLEGRLQFSINETVAGVPEIVQVWEEEGFVSILARYDLTGSQPFRGDGLVFDSGLAYAYVPSVFAKDPDALANERGMRRFTKLALTARPWEAGAALRYLGAVEPNLRDMPVFEIDDIHAEYRWTVELRSPYEVRASRKLRRENGRDESAVFKFSLDDFVWKPGERGGLEDWPGVWDLFAADDLLAEVDRVCKRPLDAPRPVLMRGPEPWKVRYNFQRLGTPEIFAEAISSYVPDEKLRGRFLEHVEAESSWLIKEEAAVEAIAATKRALESELASRRAAEAKKREAERWEAAQQRVRREIEAARRANEEAERRLQEEDAE